MVILGQRKKDTITKGKVHHFISQTEQHKASVQQTYKSEFLGASVTHYSPWALI